MAMPFFQWFFACIKSLSQTAHRFLFFPLFPEKPSPSIEHPFFSPFSFSGRSLSDHCKRGLTVRLPSFTSQLQSLYIVEKSDLSCLSSSFVITLLVTHYPQFQWRGQRLTTIHFRGHFTRSSFSFETSEMRKTKSVSLSRQFILIPSTLCICEPEMIMSLIGSSSNFRENGNSNHATKEEVHILPSLDGAMNKAGSTSLWLQFANKAYHEGNRREKHSLVTPFICLPLHFISLLV